MPHPKVKGASTPQPSDKDFLFSAQHYGISDLTGIPDVIDLRGHAPVDDQGYRPTCVGQACKTLVELLYIARGPLVPFSASFIYKHANMISGPEVLAQDQGADPRAALMGLLQFGAAPEYVEPYATDDDTTPPTQAEDAAAAPYKISSFHLCTSPEDAVAALAARVPVIVTIRAGQAFDADAENHSYILSSAALNDKQTPPNHEQVIEGCTGGADPNRGYWLCKGTWGVGVFNCGYFCVPKAAFNDFFVFPWTASLAPAQNPQTAGDNTQQPPAPQSEQPQQQPQ